VLCRDLSGGNAILSHNLDELAILRAVLSIGPVEKSLSNLSDQISKCTPLAVLFLPYGMEGSPVSKVGTGHVSAVCRGVKGNRAQTYNNGMRNSNTVLHLSQ
jgi:hypothetical protein